MHIWVLTHFGTVSLQLQNPLFLLDVRRRCLKGSLGHPPCARLPPSNLLPHVREESSEGTQRSRNLVALSCAWVPRDAHDGRSA